MQQRSAAGHRLNALRSVMRGSMWAESQQMWGTSGPAVGLRCNWASCASSQHRSGSKLQLVQTVRVLEHSSSYEQLA